MEYVTDHDWEDEAPLEDFHPPRHRIIAAPSLLVFFLVLYAIMFLLSRGWNMSLRDLAWKAFTPRMLSQFGALTSTPISEGRELWRLVTGAFVHVNLIHLIFNSYCVFSLGKAVESYYGTRRMFVSFLTCSVVANIFTVGMSPPRLLYIGTLGGLFGLDGVLLGFALRNRSALPAKAFKWMLGSALFWPVLWVVLSLTVPVFRGGIAGLIAGFVAGALLGLAFEAARFRAGVRRIKLSGAVTALFLVALLVCIVSWVSLAACATSAAAHTARRTPGHLRLRTESCEEGGFEIPVPAEMTITRAGAKLDVELEDRTFCRIRWKDAGPYDDPESLAGAAISDLGLQSSRDPDISEMHLVQRSRIRVGAEDAVYFVVSTLMRGREIIYAQAVLIHRAKVYTITFYYRAQDELAQEMADAMLSGLRFTGR